MRVMYDATAPTPHQLSLTERLQRVLEEHVRFDRALTPAGGNGPSIDFVLRTRPGLSVRLVVYQDSFHICANEAAVMIELVEPGQYESWADHVVTVTSQLLQRPLRMRVRYPLLRWFSPTGSIYLSDGVSSAWSGNLFLSWGAERVFADWYEPAGRK